MMLPFFQNSNVENLPPHVLRLVYKEVSALAADPPEGIKIYPSEEDITELHTAIEGPGRDGRMVLVDLFVQTCWKSYCFEMLYFFKIVNETHLFFLGHSVLLSQLFVVLILNQKELWHIFCLLYWYLPDKAYRLVSQLFLDRPNNS